MQCSLHYTSIYALQALFCDHLQMFANFQNLALLEGHEILNKSHFDSITFCVDAETINFSGRTKREEKVENDLLEKRNLSIWNGNET
jgi:hypothetical protein